MFYALSNVFCSFLLLVGWLAVFSPCLAHKKNKLQMPWHLQFVFTAEFSLLSKNAAVGLYRQTI